MIFNEDCMKVMQSMKSESVDLIVTDPPYRTISGGKPHKKGQPSGMLSKNDGKIFTHNDIEPAVWFPELFRILKNNGHCYIMTNTINLEAYLRIARETEFKLHNVLVWQKNNATPNRWYMKNAEYVLFLYKGNAKAIHNCGSKTVHLFKNVQDKKHPTEKPVELMQFYIENSSRIGDVVFDPFMGVGTTGKAAERCGRKFIGCEIDPQYFNIAKVNVSE